MNPTTRARISASMRRRFSAAAARVRAESAVLQVAEAHRIRPDDILGEDTRRAFAWPRQEVMLILHRDGMSLPRIGRALQRNHTTVLHGVRAAEARQRAAGMPADRETVK